MITQKFLDGVQQIPSRFTEVFGPVLYGLILANRPRVIVETGTCWGYLTAWMALGAQDVGAQFYSIDYYSEQEPHTGPRDIERVHASLCQCGVADSVALIAGEAAYTLWQLGCNSQKLHGLGLAMIDDRHTRQQITDECHTLWPLLLDWGLICGHDVFNVDFLDMACGWKDFAVTHRAEHLWLTQSSGLILMQKRPAGHET